MINPGFAQKFAVIAFPPWFGPPRGEPPKKRPPVKKTTIPEDCKYIHKELVQCLATYRDCSTDQCEMCVDFQNKYDSCLAAFYK